MSPENRKYITYCTVERGGPSHDVRTKCREVWTRDYSDTRADSQTERQTDIQTLIAIRRTPPRGENQRTRSTGIVHTSAKARLTCVAIRIRIRIRICDPIATKIQSFVQWPIANLSWKFHANPFGRFCAKLLTDRRTDKQTSAFASKTHIPPYGAQFRLPTELLKAHTTNCGLNAKFFPRCDLYAPLIRGLLSRP